MKEHLEHICEAWVDFFSCLESLRTVSELVFLWITSPIWIIPYLIYRKKGKIDGKN